MKVLLFMSVFWTLYGIAGLLGYQNIPKLLVISMLVLAIPSIVCTCKWEKKYEKMLKGGTK